MREEKGQRVKAGEKDPNKISSPKAKPPTDSMRHANVRLFLTFLYLHDKSAACEYVCVHLCVCVCACACVCACLRVCVCVCVKAKTVRATTI